MSKIYIIVLYIFLCTCRVFSGEVVLNVEDTLGNIAGASQNHAIKKHAGRALSFYKSGRSLKAKEELDVLVRIDKENDAAYRLIIKKIDEDFNQNISPVTSSKQGFDNMIASSSDGENIILQKFNCAERHYKNSELDEAKIDLLDILQIDKGNAHAKKFISDIKNEIFIMDDSRPFQKIVGDIYNTGMAFYRKQNYKEAESKFREASEIDPVNKQVQDILLKTVRALNDLKKIDEIERLLNRAELLRADGKIAVSRKELIRVLAIDPGNKKAGFYKAEYDRKSTELSINARDMFNSGEYEKSNDLVRQSLKYNKDNDDAVVLAKKLKLKLADIRLAKKNKVQATRLYNRGVTAYSKGEYRKAVELWQNVLVLDPGDKQAQKNIAKASMRIKEKEAREKINISEAVSEGLKLYEQGLLEKAAAKFEYAVRLEPGNEKAKKMLKQIADIRNKRSPDEINKR